MNDLDKRLFRFSVDTVLYLKGIPDYGEYRVIRSQLYRSATAPGANYAEAQGGCTRAQFHHRVNTSLREMREAHYWLQMIGILRKPDKILKRLLQESDELMKVLGKISYRTTR